MKPPDDPSGDHSRPLPQSALAISVAAFHRKARQRPTRSDSDSKLLQFRRVTAVKIEELQVQVTQYSSRSPAVSLNLRVKQVQQPATRCDSLLHVRGLFVRHDSARSVERQIAQLSRK
jgi:hypothetical protein